MSDIDFVGKKQEEAEADRKKAAPKGIAWTTPAAYGQAGGSGSAPTAPQAQVSQDERMKKSREEVLSMIGNEKKEQAAAAVKKSESKGWLSSLFGGGKKKEKPAPPAPKPVSATASVPLPPPLPPKPLSVPSPGAPEARLSSEQSSKKTKNFSGQQFKSIEPAPQFSQRRYLSRNDNFRNVGLKTNLISAEESGEESYANRLKTLLACATASLLLLSLTHAALDLYERDYYKNNEKETEEIETLKKQVAILEKELAIAFVWQKDLAAAKDLLSRHIRWSEFFSLLEKNTLPVASYGMSFTGAADGEYSFNVEVPSFEALTDQIAVMRADPMVESVATDSGKLAKTAAEEGQPEKTSVSFTMKLKLRPELFLFP